MATSPKLAVSYLASGQSRAEITVNEALNVLDCTVQLAVEDRDLATPPTTPTSGAAYIVASGATGAWTGYSGSIAAYYGGWIFLTPREGWIARLKDENVIAVYNGTSWIVSDSIPQLAQSITSPPTQAEVLAIQNKLNTLLSNLTGLGLIRA